MKKVVTLSVLYILVIIICMASEAATKTNIIESSPTNVIHNYVKDKFEQKKPKKTLNGTGWRFVIPDGWEAKKESTNDLELTAQTKDKKNIIAGSIAMIIMQEYDISLLTKAGIITILKGSGFNIIAIDQIYYKGHLASIVIFETDKLIGVQLAFIDENHGYVLKCAKNKNGFVDDLWDFFNGFTFFTDSEAKFETKTNEVAL